MRISGIECIPKNMEWIIECIKKSFSQTSENFIEIWRDGNKIRLSVSPTGMEFHLFIEKSSVLIRGILRGQKTFKTEEKRYPLAEEELGKVFKETIELIKAEVTKELDSVLKVEEEVNKQQEMKGGNKNVERTKRI
jgi:hypothetical protein